ncbi:hypothetical protein [Mycoplana sp. MJR14]|uniref:hypothetical protein n=1 Tax=Mycoplana sp. MJR14 TaxID=3032583 RepID=UPI0023DB64F8|nr:hypothetical protein [Mycoplana sp. MJR14]MDF1635288.1 hypothetical protein [Mycoplana sp. MJR14]
MTEGTGFETGDGGLASVLRRFPTHAAQIHALMERSENFRTMCEDLALVEQALLTVDQMPPDIRDDRRREFAELVDGLTAEIARALSDAKVVSITGKNTPPR